MKNMKFLQLLSGENCRLKILICMKMKKKYCELLSISDKDNAKGGENSGVKGGENSGVKGGDDFGDKVRIREKAQKLTDTQEKILDCIAEDKYISVKK